MAYGINDDAYTFYNQDYVPSWEREYNDEMNSEVNDQLNLDKKLEEPIITTGRIGMTITEGRNVGGSFIKTMAQAARKGTRKVEFATMDARTGGEMSIGVDSYGNDDRQVIKELSQVTGVEVNSVHTPTWIQGLSGLDPREGKVSDDRIHDILNTTHKVINFAADIMPKNQVNEERPESRTEGVSIVVHFGEFPRVNGVSLPDENLKKYFEEEEKKYGKFIVSEDAPYYLVDERTGKIVTEINKHVKIPLPMQEYDEQGNIRQPWQLKDGKDVQVESYNIKDFKKAIDYIKNPNQPENARIVNLANYLEYLKRNVGNKVIEKPQLAMYFAAQEQQKREAESWKLFHLKDFEENKRRLEALQKLKQILEIQRREVNKDPELSEQAKKIYTNIVESFPTPVGEAYLGETPKVEVVDKLIDSLKVELKRQWDGIVSNEQKIKEIEVEREFIKPLEDVALKKSLDTLAKMGIDAYKQTQKRKLPKPIWIAAENFDPQSGFGAHPEEMIYLINNARKRMVELLTDEKSPYYNPSISKDEAEKLAKQHIKATLDTEHLALWRNYFHANNPEKSDEEFMKWYTEEVDKLIKADIIGNVHIVDSKGGHVQMAPGKGDLPLKEIIKKLVKSGYKGPLNSEGWGSGDEQLFGAWKNLTTASYLGPVGGVSWSDIELDNSYLKYRTGEYGHTLSLIPSDSWKFWSGTPLD